MQKQKLKAYNLDDIGSLNKENYAKYIEAFLAFSDKEEVENLVRYLSASIVDNAKAMLHIYTMLDDKPAKAAANMALETYNDLNKNILKASKYLYKQYNNNRYDYEEMRLEYAEMYKHLKNCSQEV